MKSKTILSFLALLILALASVSAHNYPNTEYTLDFHNGDFYARNYRYSNFYGHPSYRIYDSPYKRYDNSLGSDDFTYREKLKAAKFVQKSFNERYRVTAGERSGDAFCPGCEVADSEYHASNWGNKPAFNLLGTGNNNKNYYYQIKYDKNAEKFNWRF